MSKEFLKHWLMSYPALIHSVYRDNGRPRRLRADSGEALIVLFLKSKIKFVVLMTSTFGIHDVAALNSRIITF
jgi:hypothetical protein